MGALDLMVKQGKALYVGISNYRHKEAAEAFKILKKIRNYMFNSSTKL